MFNEYCFCLGGRTAQAVVDTCIQKLKALAQERLGGKKSGGGGGGSGKVWVPSSWYMIFSFPWKSWVWKKKGAHCSTQVQIWNSLKTNQWANVCLGATTRICYDLVSRQCLPLLMMQQNDFLFQVKRSPRGQPQGHSRSWLIFVCLFDNVLGNSGFESKWLILCQSVLKVSCEIKANVHREWKLLNFG